MVYDVIVVGLGAMGSSTLYHLSKFNLNILGIDQYSPPHPFGSSHGETRLTRLAVTEGDEYLPLVERSTFLWQQIEKESNASQPLYVPDNALILSQRFNKNSFAQRTITVARKNNITYRQLNDQDVSQKLHKQCRFTKEMIGYQEPTMGYLFPEKCIEAQLKLALQNGCQLHQNEKLFNYQLLPNQNILLTTNVQNYEAKKVILTVGPWISRFINHPFNIYRQAIYWFKVEDKAIKYYQPEHFPALIWDDTEKMVLIFPSIDQNNSVKILTENVNYPENFDPFYRAIDVNEISAFFLNYIKPRFKGITQECIKAESCFYTCTSSGRFLIDYLPNYARRLIVASACSGRGFKYSAAIGETLANLAITGESKINVLKL